MTDINKATEKIEHGEVWKDNDKVVDINVKKPLDKVIPVRLSADKWEQIRAEARELGVGPSTLARIWILEHLRNNTTQRRDSVIASETGTKYQIKNK